jgi:threonine dehydrogenase-like Zn-dependent dehydrogenase
MRRADLVAPRRFEIAEVERPELGPDEDAVIVRVESMGICGSNLHWWLGGGSATGLMSFPMPGGGAHEHAGVVEAVGAKVSRVRPGDRVAVEAWENASCGACRYCVSGLFIHCRQPRRFGAGALGGYTDYLKLTEKGLYPLPGNLDPAVSAVIEPCACSVAAVRRAGLTGGETVVVLGAGVLGLAAVASARALGAGRVIVTAKHDSQAALAPGFGADEVLSSAAPDLLDRLAAACGGDGADLVIETVGGHAPTLAQAVAVARPGARIVVLGLWDELVPVDSWAAVLKDLTITFSLTYGVTGKRSDFAVCIDWIASGRLPAAALVTHRVPLADIAAGFDLAADKHRGVVKVVVTP